MKRKIVISIALVLGLALLSLVKSDSTAQAQQSQRYLSDTGIITLGPSQSLLVTVVRAATSEDAPPVEHIVQLRRMTYAGDVCNAGVCKQIVSSAATTGAIPVMPGESATFEVGPNVNGNDVRALVMSNSRDMKVNSIVFDTSTQRVVAIAHTTTTMYWP